METKENAPVGRGGVVLYNSFQKLNYNTPSFVIHAWPFTVLLNIPVKSFGLTGLLEVPDG